MIEGRHHAEERLQSSYFDGEDPRLRKDHLKGITHLTKSLTPFTDTYSHAREHDALNFCVVDSLT